MQQPPRITLDTLLNPQQFHDSLNAVGVTAAEKQAMVVLSQLVYCRDLHQLHRASVVLLLDVSKVTSCEELVSSGAFAHGQHALRWLKKKVRAVLDHRHSWPAAYSCYSSALSNDASVVELQLTALRCLLSCLQFCCEGSPLSYKQLRLACKAGVIVGVHVSGGKPGLLVSTIGPAPAAPGAPSPPLPRHLCDRPPVARRPTPLLSTPATHRATAH